MRSIPLLIALFAWVALPRAVRADTPLASLGVRSLDYEDDLERRLSSALRSSAKALGEFTVSDREMSLEQMSLAQGCEEPDAPCLTGIARTLSVDELLYGTVVSQAGSYELTLFLFDGASGKTEQQTARGISAELLSAANANDTVEKVLRRLVGLEKAAAPATTGTLRIEGGEPGVALFIDGNPQGKLDEQGTLLLTLPEGEHSVRPFGALAGSSDERTVEVVAGTEATLSLAPVTTIPVTVEEEAPVAQPESRHSSARLRRNIGFATIGLGVAFAIATVYSWVKIEHINNDHSFKEYRAAFPKAGTTGGVNNVCGPASRGVLAAANPNNYADAALEAKANDLCNQADTLEVLQYVFLGGAIVAGGVGTYLVLTARDKPKQERAQLRFNPRVSGQSAGLSATLSF